jgi:hypothetical protein
MEYCRKNIYIFGVKTERGENQSKVIVELLVKSFSKLTGHQTTDFKSSSIPKKDNYKENHI